MLRRCAADGTLSSEAAIGIAASALRFLYQSASRPRAITDTTDKLEESATTSELLSSLPLVGALDGCEVVVVALIDGDVEGCAVGW